METEIEKLEIEIEMSKEQLYSLIDNYDFTDEKTITASQELDKLLNRYNEIIRM